MTRSDRAEYLTLAFLLIAVLTRFALLSDVPAGFYLDEAAGAANAICVAERGISERGERLPLFFPVFPETGTFHTAPYIYSAAAWTRVAGTSIASFRAHVGVWSVVFICGVAAVGWRFSGRSGAIHCALAAAVSPWAFHYARVAWDPPLMPALLAWAVFFATSSSRIGTLLSSLFFAGAMYAYPTARLHVPLVMLLLALFTVRTKARAVAWLGVLLLTSILVAPLLVATLDGSLGARFDYVGITNPEWLEGMFGERSAAAIVRGFLRTLSMHLDPRFLFIEGDRNLRHGTGMVGIFSWLDLTAIVAAITMIALRHLRASERWIPFTTLCALSGFAISALTWEGAPHATRSLGALPFVVMFTGLSLARFARNFRPGITIVLLIALGFSAWHGRVYFSNEYRAKTLAAFDAGVARAAQRGAESGDFGELNAFGAFYPEQAMRYYLMHHRGLSCLDSARYAAAIGGRTAP